MLKQEGKPIFKILNFEEFFVWHAIEVSFVQLITIVIFVIISLNNIPQMIIIIGEF